jgi:hypothetical protein
LKYRLYGAEQSRAEQSREGAGHATFNFTDRC